MEKKNKGYTEEQVLYSLRKKNDIRVVGKQIQELSSDRAKGDIGNGTRGKIDFLVKYHGYAHFYVNEFKK